MSAGVQMSAPAPCDAETALLREVATYEPGQLLTVVAVRRPYTHRPALILVEVQSFSGFGSKTDWSELMAPISAHRRAQGRQP